MERIEKRTGIPFITKHSDAAVALGVIAILIIMIIPLPTIALDILLSFSITLSLMIILVAMYTYHPLEFSVFPSLLLITTLYRLALNIASTRLILLHGNEGTDAAGNVIQSFGTFVVGGNYVVGSIVFLILVIINFVVITKGSGRIAEVAARFTLDAMPGKQMSIDADLNAGLIGEEEAREKRRKIEKQADFYGAMDGASKFVRGDAIAGIIITFINILGGLIIGSLQQGMSLGDAAQTYTLLTVGDGLVTQIPALVISTAAGIVVTRVESQSNLGKEITRQIFLKPTPVIIASAILFFFGLIPGLPKFPFITLSVITGAIAYFTLKSEKIEIKKEKEKQSKIGRSKIKEKVETLLPLDVLGLEVGYNLIPLVDVDQKGDLLERIKSIRRHFALEMGIIVPPLHIRDNLQLKPNEYSVLMKGVEVAKAELMKDLYLAMNPGTVEKEIKGIATKEPAFGLPAVWITEADKERSQLAGYTVVDSSTVMATHISEVIKTHAHELLGRQEVQSLLDNFSLSHSKVVEELIPNLLTLGQVQKVLQNLLKEDVSIRDLLTILETLADYAPINKDSIVLTEYVRQALSRSITKQYISGEGDLPVITLDNKTEELVFNSIQRTEQGTYLAMEPTTAQNLITKINQSLEKLVSTNYHPILLTSPSIRYHLKRFIERFIPHLVILSHNEVAHNTNIRGLEVVSL
ncbi:MAG TPA: flagellar biosynthesis protein FlhA [Nitrospinota bacterium]|nr:flagellar biosynthesis protein FlhA [Nitrospinota bacterium]